MLCVGISHGVDQGVFLGGESFINIEEDEEDTTDSQPSVGVGPTIPIAPSPTAGPYNPIESFEDTWP